MILGILQARVSSTRLPGKVLKPILGVPMLSLQIERVKRAIRIDNLVVATSIDPADDDIERLCNDIRVEYFRGSLDDVLERFYLAALPYNPEHIVRLTGDCPMADPLVIDEVIEFYLNGKFEYASNTLEPTYPDGLDVEVFSFASLEKAWREAYIKSEREHVTPFIHTRPDRFGLGSYKCAQDYSHLRWTVDEPEDFEFSKIVYECLYPEKPQFDMYDVLGLLERDPELLKLNQSFKRNEGYQKSLEKDGKV